MGHYVAYSGRKIDICTRERKKIDSKGGERARTRGVYALNTLPYVHFARREYCNLT